MKEPETLTELIEACGYGYRDLMLHHDRVLKPEHIAKYGKCAKWHAKPNQKTAHGVPSQWATTPEEAVKKLYLELKKRNLL